MQCLDGSSSTVVGSIDPEDCENDERSWLGVVSSIRGEETHCHGKPAPSKYQQESNNVTRKLWNVCKATFIKKTAKKVLNNTTTEH